MTTSHRATRAAAILAVTLALGLAGCSSAPEPGAAPGSTSSAEAAAGGPLAFTGTTLAGAPIDASTLAARPTILWFWAPF